MAKVETKGGCFIHKTQLNMPCLMRTFQVCRVYSLGIPETSLRGLSTLTARRVRRSIFVSPLLEPITEAVLQEEAYKMNQKC